MLPLRHTPGGYHEATGPLMVFAGLSSHKILLWLVPPLVFLRPAHAGFLQRGPFRCSPEGVRVVGGVHR